MQFLLESGQILSGGWGLLCAELNSLMRHAAGLSLSVVSHCGRCNYFGVGVPGLDREDADPSAAAENARRRLNATLRGGA